jgi:MtrB/PioB family decaheme-associated outer membrane protein
MCLLPCLAAARQAPAPSTPAPAQVPGGAVAPAAAAQEEEVDEDRLPTTYGSIDLGVRASDVDGDAARYERYRDMGDGLFLERARYATEKRGWMLSFGADHTGRRDQRFTGRAVRPGQLKIYGSWDQIPMLMSRTTRTLFTVPSPGVLTIDNAIRAQVQAQPSYLATAVQTARTFELSSRRHIADGGAQFIAKNGITFDVHVKHTNRDGAIPFGGSFGHGTVVETLAPVEHRLTDFDSAAEYMHGDLLVRGGFTGSWFHNEVTSLTFDNPWRVSDAATAGSRGRAALSPSSSFVSANGLFSYRLPYRSRVNVYGSLGSLRDTGDPLLPFTVNSAVTSPALDRTETEGHAKTKSVNLTFTSRPSRVIDVDVRFRTYDYDNRTPEFLVTQRVAYDNGVSNVTNTALQHSEPFGVTRATFDGDVRLSAIPGLSAGVGFSHLAEERTHRIFEETTDNVFRLTVDSIGNRWFTLRSKYERAQRRGEGDAAIIGEELLAIGEQPGMRHFDIAERDRNRVTITGATVPIDMLSITASFAAGKDDYNESLFGLRDNQHRVYSAGVDLAPSEYLGAGISYSYEKYTSLSRSRQANPGVQFSDASRNWAADTADKAHSVIAHAEVLDIARKFDVTGYLDINRSRGTYRYITGAVVDRTLPEEAIVPTTLPPPTQLPPVTSNLSRGNVDVIYKLSERWGLGLSVWHERYRVTDFSLDAEAISRLDPAGALLLGYQYLPYTATTVWGRAVYRF